MFEFELDEEKSKSNLGKHVIDFLEAQKLWKDPDFVELKAKTTDEPRYMIIGKVDTKHWSPLQLSETRRFESSRPGVLENQR